MSPASNRRWVHTVGLLTPPAALLLALLVLPVAILVISSLVDAAPGEVGGWPPTLEHYASILGDTRHLRILMHTVWLSLLATGAAYLISFPLALAVVHSRSKLARSLYLTAALSPLLISVVLRTFGWQIILGAGGPVAELLTSLYGDQWLVGLIGTDTAAIIGLTHVLVPFVLLALLPTIDRIDVNVLNAAESLGATRPRIFWRIIVPLSREGLLAGAVIGFALSTTAYVTPALLAGRRNPVFSTLVFEANMRTFDWGLGAALAIVLLGTVIIGSLVITKAVSFRLRAPRPLGGAVVAGRPEEHPADARPLTDAALSGGAK